jgi:hypothetical protein
MGVFIGEVLEEPVACMIGDVDLPIVPRDCIPAPSVYWEAYLFREFRIRPIDPVYVRTDGFVTRGRVYLQVGSARNCFDCKIIREVFYIINLKMKK